LSLSTFICIEREIETWRETKRHWFSADLYNMPPLTEELMISILRHWDFWCVHQEFVTVQHTATHCNTLQHTSLGLLMCHVVHQEFVNSELWPSGLLFWCVHRLWIANCDHQDFGCSLGLIKLEQQGTRQTVIGNKKICRHDYLSTISSARAAVRNKKNHRYQKKRHRKSMETRNLSSGICRSWMTCGLFLYIKHSKFAVLLLTIEREENPNVLSRGGAWSMVLGVASAYLPSLVLPVPQ